MANEVVKKSETLPDQINGYTEESECGADGQGRVDWIKFDDVFMLGENSIDGERRVVINIKRYVVKRDQDFHEVDRKLVPENEKWPDIEAMNEESPRSEWRTDPNNNEVGPWMAQREVLLVDMRDMSHQLFPTWTAGGGRAVHDLATRIKHMRQFRGVRVFPEVELSHTTWSIRFKKDRPHFRITRWFMPGSDGRLIEIPSDPTKPLPAIANAPQAHVTEVKEPSLAEEADDQVPF
jgi:hypothetical protein